MTATDKATARRLSISRLSDDALVRMGSDAAEMARKAPATKAERKALQKIATLCEREAVRNHGVEKIAPAEAQANARLIAASPDLLELLTEIVALFDTGAATLTPGATLPSPQAALDCARQIIAAISKAEG